MFIVYPRPVLACPRRKTRVCIWNVGTDNDVDAASGRFVSHETLMKPLQSRLGLLTPASLLGFAFLVGSSRFCYFLYAMF